MANITYNPILEIKELSGWRLFQKRPIPEPQTALVVSGEGKDVFTLIQGQRGLTRSEMFWGKYNFLYKVDLTEHPLELRFNLPCKSDAYDFHTEVNFICSVKEPAMIVQRNVTNVNQWLEPLIVDALRSISREYEVDKSGIAEREMSDIVSQKIYDEGFNVKQLVLKLSLEEEARTVIRGNRNREAAIQQEKLEIQNKIELDKIRLQNEIELEQQKQFLEEQRIEFELVKERKLQKFEMEMMQQKTEFYGQMLQSGQFKILALQLAQNPQDVSVIIQYLNAQKQSEREYQITVLKTLLDADGLEGWQLSEVGKKALQSIIGTSEVSTPSIESEKSDHTEDKKPEVHIENTEDNISDSDSPNFDYENNG